MKIHCAGSGTILLSSNIPAGMRPWLERYGIKPVLVETFVDRARLTGLCFGAANWMRIGSSTGRGRLGPKSPGRSLKDIWVYPRAREARQHLLEECPQAVISCPLIESLAQEQWCGAELARLQLGDERLSHAEGRPRRAWRPRAWCCCRKTRPP